MSRAALLVVGFAMACDGCAGRYSTPPEPLEQPQQRPEPDDDNRFEKALGKFEQADAGLPPPDAADVYTLPAVVSLIDAIDPHEYERWPLTPNQHPALEPAYPIARAFADPSVSWLDLCRMGAQNRRASGGNSDQLEYLHAWCDVAKRDAPAAAFRLRPLVNSSVLGLPAAVRSDIANIVVDGGDATFAQDVLARARIDDLVVFDLTAAGYVEVGKIPDALQINERGIAAHDQRHVERHCMRLARKVVLSDPSTRMPPIVELARIPQCLPQYGELICWHKKHCDPYLLAHGIDPQDLKLGAVYKNWPKPGASTDEWLKAAYAAKGTAEASGELAVARAIEEGLRTVSCTGPRVWEFTNIAATIARRVDTEPELQQRLLAIASLPDVACAPN